MLMLRIIRDPFIYTKSFYGAHLEKSKGTLQMLTSPIAVLIIWSQQQLSKPTVPSHNTDLNSYSNPFILTTSGSND